MVAGVHHHALGAHAGAGHHLASYLAAAALLGFGVRGVEAEWRRVRRLGFRIYRSPCLGCLAWASWWACPVRAVVLDGLGLLGLKGFMRLENVILR